MTIGEQASSYREVWCRSREIGMISPPGQPSLKSQMGKLKVLVVSCPASLLGNVFDHVIWSVQNALILGLFGSCNESLHVWDSRHNPTYATEDSSNRAGNSFQKNRRIKAFAD